MTQQSPSDADSSNDPQEREKRIFEYLPLVKYIVGRLGVHPTPGLDTEDLFEVGVMGLIRAANSYLPDRNASFKTHAYHQIRGAILDEIRRHSPLSRGQRRKLKTVRKETTRLLNETGRHPRVEEIAQAAGMTVEELDDLFLEAKTRHILSLEDCMASGDGRDFVKTVTCSQSPSPEEIAQREEQKRRLVEEIERLPDVERKVVLLYYNEGLLLKEIGQILAKSESRISQIHSRALHLLASRLDTQGPRAGIDEERDGRADSGPQHLSGV
jgi:RNA polymerase sigma factor for flagellar operon FliA